jgi:hypothetical protein
MSVLAFKNAKVLYGPYDLSGDLNSAALNLTTDVQECTTFSNVGYKTRLQTLGDSSLNVAGYWGGPVDADLYGELSNTSGNLVSIGPTGATGSVAYMVSSLGATYNPVSGKVGDSLKFSFTAQGNGHVYRGTILENGVKTATGNGGTGLNLGAITSGKSLYAGLHVTNVSGTSTPTFSALIESAADGTFASPVTRITFSPVTAVGSQFLSVAGPITDVQFRLNWTITGTTPSFTAFLTLAIV